MKILTLVVSAILMAIRPIPGGEPFETIDLSRAENATMNHVRESPTGRVVFRDVPFELPESKKIIQTEGLYAKGPLIVHIPVDVPHAKKAYILLSGTYVKLAFKDKKVAEVTFEFGDNEKETFPIIAWKTIRETWSYDDEIQEPDQEGNPRLVNVYQEKQLRAGKPATGFLDMLVVDLEEHKHIAPLTKITFRDTSRQTVGDIAPSLVISGITIRRD